MPNLVKANLLSRKTRSFVSVFGIALSVALLLVLVGLVNGNIRDLANRISYVGADVMVSRNSFGFFYPDIKVNDKWADWIEEIEGVEKVASVLIESSSSFNEETLFNYIYGIDYDDYNAVGSGFSVVEGRELRDPDDIIVDRKIAKNFQVQIGDEVDLLNHKWRLVGIVKEALGARIFVDRHTLTRLSQSSLEFESQSNDGNKRGLATLFYVKAEDRDDVPALVMRIKDEFREFYREDEEFEDAYADEQREEWAVRNINELFGVFMSSALGLREFMIALTGICAVICFSVILLSMYNSIIERTREIGILKSLGAKKRFIFKEILKEALIITLIGIVVGYIMTLGTMMLIGRLFPLLEMEMTIDWMGYGAAIAIIASLLGTLYPASRAIRLDPVVALSHE